jgi:hypothetical protein
MLKMGEIVEQQQMGKPTELPTQKQSLGRRILMFPLTRLLIAMIVFAGVALTLAGIAILVAGFSRWIRRWPATFW